MIIDEYQNPPNSSYSLDPKHHCVSMKMVGLSVTFYWKISALMFNKHTGFTMKIRNIYIYIYLTEMEIKKFDKESWNVII